MTFETTLILQPKETEFINKRVKVYTDFLQKHTKLEEVNVDLKDLAYIKSKKDKTCTTGVYVAFKYSSDEPSVFTTVEELEHLAKDDSMVLKFLTVRTEEDCEDEDYKSEQEDNPETEQPDALDVLLGLAEYKKEVK